VCSTEKADSSRFEQGRVHRLVRFVECFQSARKVGQNLALVSVSDGALRVLQFARLDKVFKICDTVEDGIAALT